MIGGGGRNGRIRNEKRARRCSCLPAAPAAVRCGRRRSLCGVTAGRGGGDHRERQGGGVDAARARRRGRKRPAAERIVRSCTPQPPALDAHLQYTAFYGNNKGTSDKMWSPGG
jgi:hypothetical protein